MANVLFKRGLSTSLLTAGKSYDDGCFYLTTDTNHLYVGTSDNKSAKIDGNIRSVSVLPTTGEPGEFYYLPGQNILAYYDESSKKWVQLNPDTNTDTKVTGMTFKKSNQSTTEKLVYDITLLRQDIDDKAIDNVTATLEINSEDVTGILTDTAVEIIAKQDNEQPVIIQTAGNGAAGEGFAISGDAGVEVGLSDDGIQISGTEYVLSSAGTSIKLEGNGEAAGSVNLLGDTNWVNVQSGSGTNEIQVSHKTKAYDNIANGNITAEKENTLESETSFNVITAVGYDAAGHIDSVETTEMVMPIINYSLEAVNNGTNNTTSQISLKNSDAVVNTQDIIIKNTITVDGSSKTINNGEDFGSFYSASSIDNKLKAVNAMVYKGPVTTTNPLPTLEDENVKISIGDTYKVNEAGTYGPDKSGQDYICEIGYLLIANTKSTEDEYGYITEDLYWDLIESGESSDTTYTLSGDNNSIILTNNNTQQSAGLVEVTDDDIVILTVKDNQLKGEHVQIDVQESSGTQTAEYSGTITAVSRVNYDDYGHITSLQTDTISLPPKDVISADIANVKLLFTNDDVAQGSLDIDAGTDIVVTGTGTNGDLIATIAHDSVTRESNSTSTDTPNYGETFDVIDEIITSNTGHVTKVNVKTVTLPSEVVYSLNDPTITNNTVTQTFTKDDAAAGQIVLTSDTITYTIGDDKVINANLVWGTF